MIGRLGLGPLTHDQLSDLLPADVATTLMQQRHCDASLDALSTHGEKRESGLSTTQRELGVARRGMASGPGIGLLGRGMA